MSKRIDNSAGEIALALAGKTKAQLASITQDVKAIVTLTQTEYDALETADTLSDTTLYLIEEE